MGDRVPHYTPDDGPILSDDEMIAGAYVVGNVLLDPDRDDSFGDGSILHGGRRCIAEPITFGGDSGRKIPCLIFRPVEAPDA